MLETLDCLPSRLVWAGGTATSLAENTDVFVQDLDAGIHDEILSLADRPTRNCMETSKRRGLVCLFRLQIVLSSRRFPTQHGAIRYGWRPVNVAAGCFRAFRETAQVPARIILATSDFSTLTALHRVSVVRVQACAGKRSRSPIGSRSVEKYLQAYHRCRSLWEST